MTTPKINPERLPVVCRERASGYGDLRASSLTALALDQAADELDRLRAALTRIKSVGHSVLSAMDDYNAENETYLGGSIFFEMGRAIHQADNALNGKSE